MSRQGHPPPSLLRRLLIWQALALVVAWIGLGALVSSQVLRPGLGAVDQRLNDMAQLLADAATLKSDDPKAMAAHLQAMTPRLMRHMAWEVLGPDHPMIYQVRDGAGALLHSASAAPGLIEVPQIPALADGLASSEFSDAQGRRWRAVSARGGQGGIEVRVAEPAELAWSTIGKVLMDTLRSQIVVFVWHGLIIWLSLRAGLAPLTQLAQRIARRKAGDLSPVSIDLVHAETRPVVDEINALLARESARLDVEHHFLADAAHELRTPLAAVNAQAHLLLQETDPEARQQAAQALRQGIDRVSHLLTQLLTLARVDRRDTPAPLQTLDLAELLRERVALLAGLARSRKMQLDVDAPDTLMVMGDRQGLSSVIDNLVDNALRYAPAGSPVHIQLQRQAATVRLLIRDRGRGIPESDRERVFERFYRLPGTTETGTGLGLAIVRRIVLRHGGDIRFLSPDGPGALVQLEFPQAPT